MNNLKMKEFNNASQTEYVEYKRNSDENYVKEMVMQYNKDKTKGIELFLSYLEKYIYLIINTSFKSYVNKNIMEDVVQEMKLSVIENLPNYDPEQSAPTTFFKQNMIHNAYRYINEIYLPGMSMHYIAVRKKALEYCNINELDYEKIDNEKLSNLTGISLESIKVMREREKMAKWLYSGVGTCGVTNDIHECEEEPIKEWTIDGFINFLPKELREFAQIRFIGEHSKKETMQELKLSQREYIVMLQKTKLLAKIFFDKLKEEQNV